MPRVPKLRKEVFNPYKKKPDYYHCFIGEMIFKEWKVKNGFASMHAKILVIATYYDYFKLKDYKYWLLDLKLFKRAISELVRMGYMIETKAPAPGNRKPYRAWLLTKKGKDVEADFERYYDMRFKEIQQGKFGIFIDFKERQPYQRVKLSPEEIQYKEMKSNGHPKKVGIMDMWKDLDYDES